MNKNREDIFGAFSSIVVFYWIKHFTAALFDHTIDILKLTIWMVKLIPRARWYNMDHCFSYFIFETC